MRVRLHNLIFVFMAAGLVAGILLVSVEDKQADWFIAVKAGLQFVGVTVFIGMLKMLVMPLILVSIVAGVTSIPSFGEAGRIGWKTLAYYVGTTTIAVTIGLVLVLTIKPGEGHHVESERAKRTAELEQRRVGTVGPPVGSSRLKLVRNRLTFMVMFRRR